ncbi:MAG: phosphatidate cytidylyltransferase [Candidatus Hydrogenedentes bacterium]|nr:phosphatidate cytidylyltransferase [Candidatus Hydrogenedentota bacterium]
MAKKWSGLAVRVLTAAVALPIVLLLIWRPELRPAFALFIGVLVAIGLYEYYAIVRTSNISPETIGGILSGTAVALSGYYNSLTLTGLALYGGCLLVAALHIVRGQHSVAGLASSVFGVLYLGWFPAHVNLLLSEPVIGPGLVTILIVAVVLTDTGAYFAGSLLGRHKLAPKVSPNKTWEGAVGGVAVALAGMAVLYKLAPSFEALPDWQLLRYLHIGATLSVAAQIGDLAESCLKRDAGVKDSGNLFPGHGGMLDRCDGLLFAAPVMYYLHAVAPVAAN